MTNTKQEWTRFFIWLRNGFCFVSTWLLFLVWLLCKAGHTYMIPADTIAAVMLGSLGGVLLFCAVFTKVFIRKFGFAVRFTLFMALTVLYELGFAHAALSHLHEQANAPMLYGSAASSGWLVFAGIVLVMYGISMGIYAVYRKKKGALYTEALRTYQKQCQ